MKNILVPVDGSEHSCMAADWAARIAAETGAKVTLLHVTQADSDDTMALSQLTREEIKERIDRNAASKFEKARATMPAGAEFDTLAEFGSPAEQIVGTASAKGFDHIVMGSRGLTPIRELLLGSVSEIVLRRAPCPVTIVR